MSDQSNVSDAKSSSMVSRPFLVFAIVVLAVGVFAGRPIMTWIMYLQEKQIASEIAPPGPEDDQAALEGGENGPGGGGARERGPRGGGNFDPEAIFAERDANGDGKIEGDEMQGRMAEFAEQMDSDGDGAISKEEFLKRMEERRRGGRGGRAEGGGRPSGGGRPAGGGREEPANSEAEAAVEDEVPSEANSESEELGESSGETDAASGAETSDGTGPISPGEAI